MALLSLIPARAWLALGLLALAVLGYLKITSDAEDRGAASVTTKIQQEQTHAQDRAEMERRRLDRGDDSGVRGFDRD